MSTTAWFFKNPYGLNTGVRGILKNRRSVLCMVAVVTISYGLYCYLNRGKKCQCLRLIAQIMGLCFGKKRKSVMNSQEKTATNGAASSSGISAVPSSFGAIPAPNGSTDQQSANPSSTERKVSTQTSAERQAHPSGHSSGEERPRRSSGRRRHRTASGGPEQIRHCILDTLKVIRRLVDNDQEPPYSLLRLHRIAEHDEGWAEMVKILIEVIPLDEPLGAAVISLLLDECPIPTKETIIQLCESQNVKKKGASEASKQTECRLRNICVVLGCLADKMAGAGSIAILSTDIVEFLVKLIEKYSSCPPSLVLFSLIALEKFAQTNENKEVIMSAIHSKPYLERVEKTWRRYRNKCRKVEEYVMWQASFCARWSLDNLFVKENHKVPRIEEDMKNINVMLNSRDVSEYLKLSPSGLEARCDAPSFESVRCTYQVWEGVWYYEVLIITSGVMQIGWATKDSKFLNHDGYGIGDDECSMAYDGCRQLLWYNALSQPHDHPPWQPGDILGLLLDLGRREVIFSLNGQCLPPTSDLFTKTQHGFFAAASFMSFQQCRFNFGSEKFKFPPSVDFQDFNSKGKLTEDEKIILPRHKRLEMLRSVQVQDDSCNLCFDGPATVTLMPCEHRGMCMQCAMMLEICPMCREPITERSEDS